MELTDTHCHLPMIEHKPLEQVFADARAAHVTRIICIGAAGGIESARQATALAEQHDFIWATVGVHPHDAGAYEDVEPLAELVNHSKVAAVGETGLDFFREWAPFDAQRRLFESTIELAKRCGKPLIIHCRDAHEETISTLKRLGAEQVGGVFHCYAEDDRTAAELREMNFLISLTGILTFKNAGKLRESVKKIPLEQIMLETDCPFMAPEPYRGKPSEPAHVYQIAERLAEIKDVTIEEVAEVTNSTARRFFSLDG